jgi:S1-C subfamily serine protease
MTNRLFLTVFLGVISQLAAVTGQAQTPPATSTPTPPTLVPPQGKVTPVPAAVDIANEPIVHVVANVLPAVVNIQADDPVPEYYAGYNRYFRVYRGVPNRTEQSIGSGLLISVDGFILTNAHVVALADKDKPVSITLSSGSKYQAQIVTEDEDRDLALLKIEDKGAQFPFFDLAYTSPNYLGETVVALGSPEGYQNSVSHGILSARDRTFTVGEHTYSHLIQTDAAINPGNSGGPLVDLNGALAGINSAKLSGEAIENIGFAIPGDIVVPWANDAVAVARGLKAAPVSTAAAASAAMRQHLGLAVKTLTMGKAAEMNLQLSGGLLITGVDDSSPAAQAGLRENMVIVGIGNRQIVDEKSMPKELVGLQPGMNVRLHVIYSQTVGPMTVQRGGPVMLTAH